MLTCMQFIPVLCSPSANSLALGSEKRTFWKRFGLPYWQRSWYQHQRQWWGKNTCHYKLVLLIRVASFPGSGENAINSAFWKSVSQPSKFVAIFLIQLQQGLRGISTSLNPPSEILEIIYFHQFATLQYDISQFLNHISTSLNFVSISLSADSPAYGS